MTRLSWLDLRRVNFRPTLSLANRWQTWEAAQASMPDSRYLRGLHDYQSYSSARLGWT